MRLADSVKSIIKKIIHPWKEKHCKYVYDIIMKLTVHMKLKMLNRTKRLQLRQLVKYAMVANWG